jgi:TonB-dependent receptor-like protein
MSKYFTTTVLRKFLLFLPFLFISTSTDTFEDLLTALEKQTYDYIQEKVYLHLDKPYYSIGDDLWFKAYTVAGPNHTPTPLSENLFVELISEKGKIVKRITIYLNKGLGTGDFALADSLASGEYTIRAYTNWMRNFDDDFYFKKRIKLIDPLASATTSNLEESSEFKIKFFPEGGELIAGITSKVAFELNKFEDNIPGQIIDEEGNVITKFKTLHQGMGNFELKPILGKKYYAQINGRATKHVLPDFQSEGLIMSVDNLSNAENIIVGINSTSPSKQNQAYLIAHTRGLVGYSSKIEWKGNMAKVSIPKKDLASGLVHVTLFNSSWQPEAERLIFKRQKSESIKISMDPDKEQYKIRDSTSIKIKVQNAKGEPLTGFFSMSVFDTVQISPEAIDENIVSSFFLSSDIKGAIQNPSQYFDANNADADRDLNLLLMTRGWRRFVWKDILNDNFPEKNFKVEQGFLVTGKVKQRGSKKGVSKASVRQIGTFNGLPSLEEAKTKSNGKFELKNLLYYEDISFIQASGKKNRNNVILDLDEIESVPFEKNVVIKGPSFSKPLVLDEDFITKSKERKTIDSVFSFENVTDLGTVIVEGTKNNEISSNISRGLVFNRGEYGLDVNELMSRGQKFRNALYLLQGRVPGITILPGESGEPNVIMTRKVWSMQNPDPPITYLIDDAPASLSAVTAMPAELIARVEILKGMRATGLYGPSANGGIIAFYTKTPDEFNEFYDLLSQNNVVVSKNSKALKGGYYNAREFYGPNYGTEIPEHIKPDFRDLIHWEPMIFTDENGEATVTFFNADLPTTIQVNLEGLWEGGIPLASSITYQVKRK